MVIRVSVRDANVVPAWAGSTIWDVDSLQITYLRGAGLGGYTGVRSRRKVCPPFGGEHNLGRRLAPNNPLLSHAIIVSIEHCP